MKLEEFINQLKKYPQNKVARVIDARSKSHFYFGFKFLNSKENKITFHVGPEKYWDSPLTYGDLIANVRLYSPELDVYFSDPMYNSYKVRS